jgi:hypothetical protein
MQLSSVDLEFIKQREFLGQRRRALVRYAALQARRPLEMARIKFDDADQAYVNTTIMPDLDAWEQKFSQKFNLDKEGLVADFDESRLLRAAEATRINNQRLKIMSGISTQNECRAENGDPPLPGGDVLLTPVNLAASGSDMSGTAPDGAGTTGRRNGSGSWRAERNEAEEIRDRAIHRERAERIRSKHRRAG